MNDPRVMQQELDEQRRKVDVDNYTITVRELLSMAERSELHRAPEYQRKFRWDEEAESRLIESLLLGLPIPNLFFATNPDGTWEVVDGLQRISTLIHYASESTGQLQEIHKKHPLRLSGLRKLQQFNGLTFDDLPSPVKLTFTKRGLGVTALSDKSDTQARFDTFERLNSGAVALSAQEVRACIYDGLFNDMIRRLATTAEFRELVKLQSRDQDNATHEELVLKFFAYLQGREKFFGAVRDFLNSFMEQNRDAAALEGMDTLFERVVRELFAILNGPFLRNNTNVTPQNELEAVMVGAAEVLRKHDRLGNPPSGWLDDPDLVRASTGATNTRTKLRDRIARAKELLTPQA
jgi:hypothetical protein